MRAGITLDERVVTGFGDEWTRFDQSQRSDADLRETFDRYFSIFPWDDLPRDAVGVDVGCGTGRWARFASERAGRVVCVDASRAAASVANRNLIDDPGCQIGIADAGILPFPDETFDFGYSLGVLHHLPDPAAALREIVRTLKPGAPFLVYLYYALDNRPTSYRLLFRAADEMRRIISRLPTAPRSVVSDIIAMSVYFPLSRLAAAVELTGRDPSALPLAPYRSKPFYVLRTDALDRFGTKIEHRFSHEQVLDLLESASLVSIRVSDRIPLWCAVGWRSRDVSSLPVKTSSFRAGRAR